jgi:hypothetical protein
MYLHIGRIIPRRACVGTRADCERWWAGDGDARGLEAAFGRGRRRSGTSRGRRRSSRARGRRRTGVGGLRERRSSRAGGAYGLGGRRSVGWAEQTAAVRVERRKKWARTRPRLALKHLIPVGLWRGRRKLINPRWLCAVANGNYLTPVGFLTWPTGMT